MSQQAQSVIRAILMGVGAFLIGHHIFNQAIDATMWDTITGIVIAGSTTVWGVIQKTTGEEQLVAFVKQLAVFVGGIFVASGKLTADQLSTWIGIITVVLTTIFSIIYKKNKAVQSNSSNGV